MAIDSYMYFQGYDSKYLQFESQVVLTGQTGEPADIAKPFLGAAAQADTKFTKGVCEVEDYSFDIEQVLNIGSQSSGAGAGKITFNPFSITRKIDSASTAFYQASCSGKPYKQVGLGMRKSAGTGASGMFFLAFTFKLVAVKTMSWAHDDESPKETITFEYGGLTIQYAVQKPDGSFEAPTTRGWNRVKNTADDNLSNLIT